MTWNNTPCHHPIFYFILFWIMETWHVVTKLHVMNFFKKQFWSENKFFAICYDVYMFIDYIYTIYVYERIHQGLNPRPHGSTPRS
jgi:hypothetical protein